MINEILAFLATICFGFSLKPIKVITFLFCTLYRELGYVDAFRIVNQDDDEFSWWPGGKAAQDGWRVDLQVVSAGLRGTIEYGVLYKVQEFSSHAPLIMDYDIEPESL